MKVFDGILKFTYQTVFGKVQILKNGDDVVFNQIDSPNIANMSIVTIPKFHMMRFDTRREAFLKLKQMETDAIRDLLKLLG